MPGRAPSDSSQGVAAMMAVARAALPIVCYVAALRGVLADVYLHNPRGSNDRNCERNVNRNNG